MLKINKQNITLTRGDTAYLRFRPQIRMNNDPIADYTFESGDSVVFRLKKDDGILEKSCVIDLENNTAILTLVPGDTIDLLTKVYTYEVELITQYGEHFTFIADQYFTIGKEVEEHGN